MKLSFVVRTPTGTMDLVKFRLPIKHEPFFDQELAWLGCKLSNALQGIDLRGHEMVMCVVSAGGQPVLFSDWEATAYRVQLTTENYQEQRRVLEAQIQDVFNPNNNEVTAEPMDTAINEFNESMN